MPESEASIAITVKTAQMTYDVIQKALRMTYPLLKNIGSQQISQDDASIKFMGKEQLQANSGFIAVDLSSDATKSMKKQLKHNGVDFRLFKKDADAFQLVFKGADHEKIKNALENVIKDKSIEKQIKAAQEKAATINGNRDISKEMRQGIER